jgi:nucleoid-associated protein YgaU
MARYTNIPVISTVENPKRRYTVVKYPLIPLGESDLYVYTTKGDRFDILALNYYGDSSLWWIINRANSSQLSDSLYPRVGAQIRIPAPQRVADILSQYNALNGTI